MPLYTQIVRNNEPLPIEGGWSWWHLDKMDKAIRADLDQGDVYPGAYPYGYVFKHDHKFEEKEEYIWSRGAEVGKIYIFEIKAGDVYKCWR